jgi:hypothetical protein
MINNESPKMLEKYFAGSNMSPSWGAKRFTTINA